MTEIKNIDGTLLAWKPIPRHERQGRRAAERQAVAELIAALGGDSSTLSHDAHGAPLLPGCHISISHSQRLAVVAMDRCRPIGIDAEELRPTLARVKPKYVSDAESAWADDADLLRLWTVKEAVYKLAGKPRLAFTAIDTKTDWSGAIADGRAYDLHFLQIGETIVCLSTETG